MTSVPVLVTLNVSLPGGRLGRRQLARVVGRGRRSSARGSAAVAVVAGSALSVQAASSGQPSAGRGDGERTGAVVRVVGGVIGGPDAGRRGPVGGAAAAADARRKRIIIGTT